MNDITLCSRCKQNEGTVIHLKRLRKDGTYYILKWCKECKTKSNKKYQYTPASVDRKYHEKIDWVKESKNAIDRILMRQDQGKYMNRGITSVKT